MSTESIPCPYCGGDGQLDCAGGCPGNDPSCLTCGGAGPFRCECKSGEIERPAYCALCYEGELVATVKPTPAWIKHPVFLAEVLTWLWKRGRLQLEDCDRRFCETCKPLVGEPS